MEQYLKEIRRFPPFTKEEEKSVIDKAKAGDRKAYEELLNRNLRFVVSVAKKYQNQGLPLDELIAEGNTGLVKAFDRFDPTRDSKFITYAVWWIKQTIRKAIEENTKIVRLPLNVLLELSNLRKMRTELEQELGHAISDEELIEYSDDEEVIKVLKYNYGTVDIDAPRTDNSKDLNDILPDNTVIDPAALLEDVKDELEFILDDFSERERDILIMYFGIDKLRPYTLKEIGVDHGLTRERIRQIKEKTIDKLKDDKYANQLREYLG